MNVRVVATAVAAGGLAIATLAACSSGSSSTGASVAQAPVVSAASPASAGYWTEDRLKAAQEFKAEPVPSESATPSESAGGSAPSANQNARTLRVGALFEHDSSGNHFCTASVVDSPKQNVLITAAHCVNGGRGGANKENIAFVPGYSDGNEPFGVWTPHRYVLDSRWVNNHDEHFDVAFVVLKPHQGKNVQEVLGGNAIEFNPGYRHYVRVTGYPSSARAPVTCANWTSQQDEYVKFECGGYYGGTSGSPWVANFNAQTHHGTVVGILGGYLEGGSVHNISFSSYLGEDIKKLYDDASSG
jgi:V8-like Glu-specific endopeptidase